jgi:uncharacterized membrane protein
MHQIGSWIPVGLVIVGFFSLLLGICFLAWGAVQKSATAGTDAGPSGILEAIAKLVDSLAKYFPNGASKVGGFLVFLGIFLIGAAYYVSTHYPQ